MPIHIFYVRKQYRNRQLLGTYSVSGTESGEKQNPALSAGTVRAATQAYEEQASFYSRK